jgi:hypothetical protein
MINDNNGEESDCQLFPELAESRQPSVVRPVDSPALQLN